MLRILIDDEGQCRTQRAVLACFAATLPQAQIAWASQLPRPARWADAPPASARRLRVLMAALEHLPGRHTVYVPGHLVPGDQLILDPYVAGAPVPEWTTVADLDIFLADNGSPAAIQLAQQAVLNPDYQSCSAFPAAGLATLPTWIRASGLASVVLITARPWYFAQAQSRSQWLAWLRRALHQSLLTLEDVRADVCEGLVRPSLLQDASALLAGDKMPLAPDATLDSLFTCPEVRLSDAQYAMLHSAALQARTTRYHRIEAARKSAEARDFRPPQPSVPLQARAARKVRSLARRAVKNAVSLQALDVRKIRSLARRAVKKAYYYYSISLRPLIRGSDASRSRSQ